MAMEQQWAFRPTFSDPWDIFSSKETETLTKALQNSFSSKDDIISNELVESLFAHPPIQTPTISGASENEISAVSKRLPPTGRVTKRKSRSSKRATTTFITADPVNFRQMVQQVTGAQFGGLSAPILNSDPQIAVNRMQIGGNCLPTLDTSSYFLDSPVGSALVRGCFPSPADNGAVSAGLGFDSLCSFPTLESWKV